MYKCTHSYVDYITTASYVTQWIIVHVVPYSPKVPVVEINIPLCILKYGTENN